MYTCIFVDDDAAATDLLVSYAERYGNLDVVAVYNDPVVALREIPDRDPVDFMFIDIEMPGISGIRLAQMVREHEKAKAILFVTAYNNFASETHALEAAGYQLKPVSFEDFLSSVTRVLAKWKVLENSARPANASFIEIDYKIADKQYSRAKIPADEVVYLESQVNYVDMYTINGKKTTHGTLKDLIEKLRPFPQFVQVHRSYVISLDHLSEIRQRRTIVMKHTGGTITIGEHYRESFFDYLATYEKR